MKPGGWQDAVLFACGAIASVTGVLSWSLRETTLSPDQSMRLREGVAFALIATLLGAGVYQAAQARRRRADILYPRRNGRVISLVLGVAFPILLIAGGRALDVAIGNGASLLLVGLLPWVLSRAQWTTVPPRSE